ncbi:hypothetical protein OEZ85_006114 [Tetradesmus obliquus]|uniref:AB hydrolase-1 domain-containing protein n=1 Tax=Tetradesmus obliquus TaxID=3088 RepID=A0ABY8UJC2_TETOB|nr:hypothetical protein OEZ85_006114 [Tetradesmus obliquus]
MAFRSQHPAPRLAKLGCLLLLSLLLHAAAPAASQQNRSTVHTSVLTGPRTGGTVSAASKTWKPVYPFPQCLDNTLTYDVSFVGQRQYIQVGSVRYAYHRFGPLRPDLPPLRPAAMSTKRKDPAPVVFISGWGLTMYMWPIPLLQRLADSREVVIFDNMRTGLSTDNSSTPLSIPLMANSTAALITKLGLSTPDIWSWSVGAFVGYGLLAYHPNKVGNVIIAAGSPGGPDALLPPEPVTQSLARFEQNYTAMLPYLFPGGLKDEAVCSFYASYTSFYQSLNLPTPLGQRSLLEQSQATVKFFMDGTIIGKLGAVPNRVLILHGVQDRLMPVRNALLGAWKLLGSWMLQFPGEGHGIPFSNVQAVITTTLEFFSFANPLSRADMNQWANYGGTASSRMLGQNVTLVVRAEPARR